MKVKLIVLFVITFSYSIYSQTAKLTSPNLQNEYTVSLEKNINDGVDVLIKDSKNPGLAGAFSVDKDAPATTLVANVYTKIAEISKEYYFIIDNANLGLKVTNTSLPATNAIFLTSVTNLSKNDFIKLMKSKTVFNNDVAKTTYDNFKSSLVTSKPLKVFTTNINLTLIKDGTGNIVFQDTGTPIATIDTSSEEKLFETLWNKYKADIVTIQNTFFTAADFTAMNQSITIKNTKNDTKLEDIYKQIVGKSDFTFINNYDLTDLTTVPPTVLASSKQFSVSIKNNFDQNFFTLKFCDNTNFCKETMQMPYDIDKTQFTNTIKTYIKDPTKLNESIITISDVSLENLYGIIKNNNEKKLIQKNSEAFLEKEKSLIEQIENLETQYSGILKINKEIRVYKRTKKNFGFSGTMTEVENIKFIVKDTTYIRFFNNRAKDMHIRGYLQNNPDIEFRILNFGNSVPMRSFNNSTHYVPISPKDNDAHEYYININDLFDFDNDKSWNYSVRNKEYNILLKKPVKIEERKLMDYFTAVLFSDFIGLNSANANGLIQAEGRLKIPIWIFNYGATSYMNSLNADVNTTLYNGFEDKSRYINPLETKYNATDTNKIDQVKINNFDYIKFSNFNAGLYLNCLNFELKGLSTEWSFGVGGRYYRSALRNTLVKDGKEDIVNNYQLNALTYEVNTNFEIRPQLNFGADLNIAYNWLHSRGASDNLKIVINEDNENNDKRVIRFQLNLYSKLNPDKSNDGIYARLGGFYQLGAKEFYPQILFGYATNLSSFVNKFKKK